MKKSFHYIVGTTNLEEIINQVKSNDPELCTTIVIDTSRRTNSELINFYSKLISETNLATFSIVGPTIVGDFTPIIKAISNNYHLKLFYISGEKNHNLNDIIKDQIDRNQSYIIENLLVTSKTLSADIKNEENLTAYDLNLEQNHEDAQINLSGIDVDENPGFCIII